MSAAAQAASASSPPEEMPHGQCGRQTEGGLEDEDRLHSLREVGCDAVWVLSSAKQGNGIEQLRDGSCDTFWQSDGFLPHLVNLSFPRKCAIAEIHLYMSFKVKTTH